MTSSGDATTVSIDPQASVEQLLTHAASITPRAAQVAWQRRRVCAFTHFGMNTFTDREWGSGMEDAATFDPDELAVDQWMAAYRSMGAQTAMLTVKHHDGFVLYPTRYSPHSVAASQWARRTCNGDVLARYVDAARRAGLNVGVYLSPSDGAELPHRWHAEEYLPQIAAKPAAERSPHEQATWADAPRTPSGLGRYGNGSRPRPRTIPTLVTDDDRAHAVASGALASFHYEADDYDAYYLNQLYELFTEYGPITELWLDGANPWADSGIRQEYDFGQWFDLIQQLSPETVIFGGPAGVRWIGNEDGYARESEWSVVAMTADPVTNHNEELITAGPTATDLGSMCLLSHPDTSHLQWSPAEADTSLRPGWFFHREEEPKSVDHLVTTYERSVGRNAVLLLNAPPAPTGRIVEPDADRLAEFGALIRATYDDNLLATRPDDQPTATDPLRSVLADDDSSSGWSPSNGATAGSFEIDLGGPRRFDRVRLGEDITRGQRIEEVVIDHDENGVWVRTVAATTVGHCRLLPLDAPVTTTRVRVRVLRARATPLLCTLGLHLYAGA